MTVHLDTDTHTPEQPRVLNIVTITVLNLFCFLGLSLGARILGMGWGWALLVGWLGGGAAAFSLAVVLTILLPVASQRELIQDRRAAERLARQPDTMTQWDQDAQSDTSLIAQWDMDAEAEAEAKALKHSEKARNAA